MERKNFNHPFQPYDIQQQFMEAIYACIEEGKVGIFESPTGTGKSLSLICSSLTWLRDHKRKNFDEAIQMVEVDDDDPIWMAEHAREERRRAMRQLREDFDARLKAIRQKEEKLRERIANGEPAHKKRKVATESVKGYEDDENFALDEYESDCEGVTPAKGDARYSNETLELMKKLGILPCNEYGNATEECLEETKVYFCSRTHSQLTQFVGELQRVKLPSSLPIDPHKKDENHVENLKHLALGSRRNLCINPKVVGLGNQTAINERCIELQQPSVDPKHKCPHLPNKQNQDLVIDFRDHALAKVRDIEDLNALGIRLDICPYYASRSAIDHAEMVTLPYPMLLQKSARDALGISLKGNVVIIDEAHNLMDAIESIHSVQITAVQLDRARESLLIYLQKFRTRLKGKNRVYVTQVVRVIDSLLAFTTSLDFNQSHGMMEPGQLLSGKAVDQVNLTKLVRYINDSKLARKVEGYLTHTVKSKKNIKATMRDLTSIEDLPVLTHVQKFLMTLLNPSKEGKFFWARGSGDTTLRYILLDPSEHFSGIVNEARAVILAGGTMSPIEDFKMQLFPNLSSIVTFSCGHLIPPTNLLVRVVGADKDGLLEFGFSSRNTATFVRAGKIILEIASLVKGGLVVFFPSYGFLDQISITWQRESISASLQKLKPAFWDSRGRSAEESFKAYKEAVAEEANGATLLSVIGGKLSEGINFSDDLGRCVIVVGLPFPNLETPEWKAKMQYMDEKGAIEGEPRGKPSREHAENVCIRSVNQAIGRVIRHKDDWASIILMDSRYSQHRIQQKLPGWIRKSYTDGTNTKAESVVQDIDCFMKKK
ncbi:hypothetical protein M433DRAFT_140653 [Acidomyces richmondensis BFW]|nr:MAG: hypothetical protein FE78DRAFT_77784 [Acidomyces sp. 'richmondensis']KYG48806.1 hypothetical protein M433DRAFT_140653 [Acidomyces richmondensis BFW]